MKNLAIALSLLFAFAAAPALAQTQGEFEGIYVMCPKKSLEYCEAAAEDFRRLFPDDQNAPYMMIRKDGKGYLADLNKSADDFAWEFLSDSAILVKMERGNKHVKYHHEGRLLKNLKTGELYIQSMSDSEWNKPRKMEKAPKKSKKKSSAKSSGDKK